MTATTTDPASPPEATHILVVDDEPYLLRVADDEPQKPRLRVTTAATDGAAALDCAATTHPDLSVLDLGLPDLDGLEVIRRLRARAEALPIIVLSARSASQEKVAALDLGATTT